MSTVAAEAQQPDIASRRLSGEKRTQASGAIMAEAAWLTSSSGILFRQPWQVYLGDFQRTYIFCFGRHAQKTNPGFDADHLAGSDFSPGGNREQ